MPDADSRLRRWISGKVDEMQVVEFAQRTGLKHLPALVLWNRGYRDEDTVRGFLNPSLQQLRDPFELPDIQTGVDRLLMALDNDEKILVHGDYDVDGITGTALLTQGLTSLGFSAEYYLPNRMREGYGLSVKAIEEAKKREVSIILTTDCGTTALQEVELARQSGIDVIITDHHQPGEKLPPAYAVINPKRADSYYPFSELAGVGVAYKLLDALYQRVSRSRDDLNKNLDLVALGTIADVTPLIDENRVFAKFGLECMSCSNKIGMRALLEVCGLAQADLTASHVSFSLAPRLNASGRMGDALQALRLLLATDAQEAHLLAVKLDRHNRNRRQIEEAITDQARVQAEKQIADHDARVLVCYRHNWHEGVIGIVASRLTEEFYRPAVLFADKDGMLKGSGRSIPGFNLYDALAAVSRHLVSFGGHEAAAGLVIEKTQLKSFFEEINRYAVEYDDAVFQPTLHIEAEVELSEFDAETTACFRRFRPFGVGNPRPCFATRGLEVVGIPRVFGKNHLKFTVRKDKDVFPVVAFGQSELILKLEPGRKEALDLAYRVSEDSYWGKGRLELVSRDIRLLYEPEDFNA